jgi:hypothetical protein
MRYSSCPRQPQDEKYGMHPGYPGASRRLRTWRRRVAFPHGLRPPTPVYPAFVEADGVIITADMRRVATASSTAAASPPSASAAMPARALAQRWCGRSPTTHGRTRTAVSRGSGKSRASGCRTRRRHAAHGRGHAVARRPGRRGSLRLLDQPAGRAGTPPGRSRRRG